LRRNLGKGGCCDCNPNYLPSLEGFPEKRKRGEAKICVVGTTIFDLVMTR